MLFFQQLFLTCFERMKEVEIADGKALLVRSKDKVYAVGTKCTHYGAPLKTGAICNGRIRCPWHGACFSLTTGDIEDYPGIDPIHSFPVSVKGDEVSITVTKAALTNTKRSVKMASYSAEDKRVFVIVGGGPAGAICAETLRKEGFTGKIVLISKEKLLPYDRPKLSKALSIAADKIVLRPAEFYAQNNIEMVLGKEVHFYHSVFELKEFQIQGNRCRSKLSVHKIIRWN